MEVEWVVYELVAERTQRLLATGTRERAADAKTAAATILTGLHPGRPAYAAVYVTPPQAVYGVLDPRGGVVWHRPRPRPRGRL